MGSSMNTAVSGLRAHQLMLDVVSNNIANVNTPGYKAARTTFADVLSQTLNGAVAPAGNLGGLDPEQVGLGVKVGAITNQFTQGGLQTTGKSTDLAIQGEGFFVLSDGTMRYYTRSGAFEVDASGHLVDSVTGYRVQGSAGDIQIMGGMTSSPNATTTTTFTGNLDITAATGDTYDCSIAVYDSLGAAHTVTVTFTKTAVAGQFTYATSETDPTMTVNAGGSGTIQFDGSGAITAGATGSLTLDFSNGASSGQVIGYDFASSSNIATAVTGLAAPNTLTLANQDGFASGTMQSFSIGSDGTINAFSNGRNHTIGTLLLASFNNPAGLVREGQNLFRDSVNSGLANLGAPGTGGRGTLAPGSLEGSNVDLADEFTRLIVAQRGFQANARVITASDELLTETVNLKR
jgi:flagellar hook protein FlgE